MAYEEKPQVIIVRLREGPTWAERLAYSVIGMLGGICATLGVVRLFRAF